MRLLNWISVTYCLSTFAILCRIWSFERRIILSEQQERFKSKTKNSIFFSFLHSWTGRAPRHWNRSFKKQKKEKKKKKKRKKKRLAKLNRPSQPASSCPSLKTSEQAGFKKFFFLIRWCSHFPRKGEGVPKSNQSKSLFPKRGPRDISLKKLFPFKLCCTIFNKLD